MPRKKFVDKKKAETFKLVDRSAYDPLFQDDTASKKILVPKYDKPEALEFAKKILPPEILPGQEISLPPQPYFFEVDSDLEEALEGGSDFEELDDNFISLANKTPEEDDEDEKAYIYEKGVSKDPTIFDFYLKKKNQGTKTVPMGGEFDDAEEDQQFGDDDDFEEDEDDEEENEEKTQKREKKVRGPTTQERAILEKRFEKLMDEYSDEEEGEVHGTANIHDFEDVLDEFLEKKEQDEQGTQKLSKEEIEAIVNHYEGESSDDKEVVVLSDNEEKWDCESILSTYSNLENHPKLIAEPSKQHKIKLSEKTGLPVEVFEKKSEKEMKRNVENKGKGRAKEETPEEKKQRKLQVKLERKASREKKKNLKIAYKQESIKQQHQHIANPGLVEIKL